MEARSRLEALLGGFAVTQMLYVAARLNLADHLARGPVTVVDLATECDARPDPLHRIVRALAAAGVFAVDEAGRVSNTALSECLRSSLPDSLRPLALVYGEEHYHAMTELLSAVRRGGTAFEHAYRKSHYSYLASNTDAARAYNEAINIEAARSAEAAVRAHDFSRARTVVDVGGREGHLIRAVLHANRHVKGVLVESSGFANKARARLRADGLTERCEVEVADIFDAVPADGDVYAFNGVISTLDDERALRLLRNCRRVMARDSRLLIIDQEEAALSDAIALAVSGGRGRTLDEHRTLLKNAGLKLVGVQSTGAGDHIIEACSS